MTVAVDKSPADQVGAAPARRHSASTRSARSRWTRCRRPTPGTPARRWRMAPVAYYLWQYLLRFDPAGPDLAQPRPLRALGRPRLDAALLAAPPDRRQGGQAKIRAARRAVGPLDDIKQLPPARQPVPRPSRVPLDLAASRPPPARWARAWPTASAWPSPSAGWPRTSTSPGFETLIDFNVYALCGDGDMMEGISARGRLARRPLQALQPLLDLRQQPHHHRRQHRAGLQRGRGHPLPRLRLERHPRRRRQRPRHARARLHDVFHETDRPADPDHRRQPHRLRRAEQAGHQRRPRRAAGRGGDPADQASYGWPEDAKFLVPDGVYEHFQRGHRRARQGAARRLVRAARASTRPSIPSWPTSSTGCSTASSPTAGTRTCRPSRPTPRAWRRRDSSGKVLNALAKNVPWLIGGAADLAPSTKTRLTFEGAGDFEAGSYGGRNFHFGIREHAMGAILNGMALVKVRAFGVGLPDLQRLRPDADPPGGDHGDPGHLRLHARLDRRRRGRPDAPAGRAARRRCARSPA